MNPKITISSRNSKLNGIRSFSLPAVSTCPYATDECKAYCYARKGRFNYPNVRKALEDNLEATKRDDFVSRMNELLSPNERYFRIHASGDFYSLEYYFIWSSIARRNPHITFLAYTRNVEVLEWYWNNDPPENLNIIQSVDQKAPLPVGRRYATIIDKKHKDRKHLSLYSIGVVSGYKTFICNSDDCLHCRFCWTSTHNIAFPQQYEKYSKED